MHITSRKHPLIQLCRELHAAKGRKTHGLFLIEGRNAVEAALHNNWPLRHVFSSETSEDENTIQIPAELLEYASESQSNPRILAIGELPAKQSLASTNLGGMILVIDGVSDPGNVGTLLRAADAAGAKSVIATSGSCDLYSPKVVRSAAGSLFSLQILNIEENSTQAIAQSLYESNIPIITAEAHGPTNCYEMAWPQNGALVLGHERRGISPEFSDIATYKTTIPIYGNAESLNVAMAGTLLLYAWRQSKKAQ
jgi:TrmH family RNA methyltransferase